MIKRQLSLLILVLLATSCQHEESAINPPAESLPVSLRDLMMRVSQHPTSIDNMIDNTSCYSVNLPVSLIVNGQQITVFSEAGYGSVSFIVNESSSDQDSVEYVYPIAITKGNFEQITVNSQEELNLVLNSCNSEVPGEIGCVDFNYPITFKTYNSDFQFADAITIMNDPQLYNFLDDMIPAYLMEVKYPVTMTNGQGQSITADSNEAFQEAIQNGIESCPENANKISK